MSQIKACCSHVMPSLQVVCDVVFSVKPISNKPAARWTDVYDVEPQRAAIQPHSFSYVTITFHPPSMQVSLLLIVNSIFTKFFFNRAVANGRKIMGWK